MTRLTLDKSSDRNAFLKRERRRNAFLLQLQSEVDFLRLTPKEASVLVADDLRTVKKSVKLIKRRLLFEKYPTVLPPPNQDVIAELAAAQRPLHRLSYLNRARLLLPQLVDKTVTCIESSMTELLTVVAQAAETGGRPTRLLDILAIRLSLEAAAALLYDLGFIDRPLDEETVAHARSARRFWDLFAEGRGRYAALVQAGEIRPHRGDWGFFTHHQLLNLLPGIVLPDHFVRHEFIINYYDGADAYFCADVYASNGSPLFQHPFWPPGLSARERKQIIAARRA
jgi:hypothetical protein